ncbi:hypothetical protein Bca101_002725 [Brassica carinata]
MESPKPILDFEKFDDGFVQKLVYDALVWSSLHGLVVSDKTYQIVLMRGFDLQRSGTVPEENDFFKVFGPAFKRNARWSVNTRVPNLGDENTPVKEVDSYYNFWYAFKSWREFPEEEEHDLEEADSREEKRWMEHDLEEADSREEKRLLSSKRKTRRRRRSFRLLGISVAYVEDLCMSLNTEQLRKLCDKMENKEGLKLAKVLKNGNNDETESEEEEVVEAKQNGHVEANGIATQSPRAAAMI